MSLLDQAAADLTDILSDATGGFAIPILVIPPDLREKTVNGIAADIGQTIDPETGMMVSGRRASIALPIAKLREQGLDDPRGVASGRPWLVRFTLPTGRQQTFKVTSTQPDKLGSLVCFLEDYQC